MGLAAIVGVIECTQIIKENYGQENWKRKPMIKTIAREIEITICDKCGDECSSYFGPERANCDFCENGERGDACNSCSAKRGFQDVWVVVGELHTHKHACKKCVRSNKMIQEIKKMVKRIGKETK